MTKNEKVWIYNPLKKKFKQYNKNDPRLDWNYKYTPEGMVKIRYYSDFNYVFFGDTKQEVCDKENKDGLERIKRLEEKIEYIKNDLLRCDNE